MNSPIHLRILQLAMDIQREDFSRDDLAVRASELSNEVAADYVAASSEGELPTPAQGVALARFLRGRLTNGPAQVSLGGFSLPDGYISVFCEGGYEAGIDRDGRTST